MRALPGLHVRAHDEWGISYGHHPWCNARLPLTQLFRAVRHYYEDIIQDKSRIWWQIPQARVLFNSPYHSCSPSTRSTIIQRIINHFRKCAKDECTCHLQDFFDSIDNKRLIPIQAGSFAKVINRKKSARGHPRQGTSRPVADDSPIKHMTLTYRFAVKTIYQGRAMESGSSRLHIMYIHKSPVYQTGYSRQRPH